MTSRRTLALSLLIFVLSGFAAAQTLADSDPVLQGTATYTMPQSVIDAEIDGTVVVRVQVDATGNPTKAVLVAGPRWPCGSTPTKALEELSSTLTDSIMKLRFLPATKKGKPISKEVDIKFALRNPKLISPPEIDPATGKVKPRLVSGGVLNGKATYLAKPSYPVRGVGGPVSILVLVDEQGKVIRAGPFSGASMLQSAALDAACRSTFSPLRLSGNPIKIEGTITYIFNP